MSVNEYDLMVIKDDVELYSSPEVILNPPISVILSTYNRFRGEGDCACLLRRAVESILNQTFKNFELILIDDYSTDTTKDFCIQTALKDSRVRFFHFKSNSGLPAKRYNFGIAQSRGKYLTFMFDDDQWELNALHDLYEAIEKSDRRCGMVYGLAQLFCGEGLKKVSILGERWGVGKIDSKNFIANNSVIVKRSVIDLVGGYDEDPIFARNCDWDLWRRIGRKFKVVRMTRQVGIVYSGFHDSIGMTKVLNLKTCKKRQKVHRFLPLQVIQKESLRCQLRAFFFDLYCATTRPLRVSIFCSGQIKRALKQMLPSRAYALLKKLNQHRRKLWLE